MDKKTLVKYLKELFIRLNQAEKKYADVWISKLDFGGLYETDMFVLHVKTENRLENHADEISTIIDILFTEMPEVYAKIWRVAVYPPDEVWNHYTFEDTLILSAEHA